MPITRVERHVLLVLPSFPSFCMQLQRTYIQSGLSIVRCARLWCLQVHVLADPHLELTKALDVVRTCRHEKPAHAVYLADSAMQQSDCVCRLLVLLRPSQLWPGHGPLVLCLQNSVLLQVMDAEGKLGSKRCKRFSAVIVDNTFKARHALSATSE